jgi:hypothetical protein
LGKSADIQSLARRAMNYSTPARAQRDFDTTAIHQGHELGPSRRARSAPASARRSSTPGRSNEEVPF